MTQSKLFKPSIINRPIINNIGQNRVEGYFTEACFELFDIQQNYRGETVFAYIRNIARKIGRPHTGVTGQFYVTRTEMRI